MTASPNKLNWKIAATVGTISGVAIGGFAFAAPDNDWTTRDGVILEDIANSAPRLSAPVVAPTTAASARVGCPGHHRRSDHHHGAGRSRRGASVVADADDDGRHRTCAGSGSGAGAGA